MLNFDQVADLLIVAAFIGLLWLRWLESAYKQPTSTAKTTPVKVIANIPEARKFPAARNF